MKLFGFEISRELPESSQNVVSFVENAKDDGTLIVAAGGAFGATTLDLDGTMRSESELITRYRTMSLYSEIDNAIEEIMNESIVQEKHTPVIRINLDELDNIGVPEQIKKAIVAEFNNILQLLEFNEYCYDIFKRWYIDGRLFYHIIIDTKNPSLGVQKLRYIDPRKIKKIKEVKRKLVPGLSVSVPTSSAEYYIYNEKGFNLKGNIATPSLAGSLEGLKIAKDSIAYVTSGLTDSNKSMVLGFLHKAISPLNQLNALEDATVIYRITRAPERRIFYIDVGDLPKNKAEQHVKDMMIKHKNRLAYNAEDGSVKDQRRFVNMLDDFWIPRRGNSSGTEIATLPGLQNVNNLDDVNYFKEKLFRSLNVPISRLQPDQHALFGNAAEVTRDELKFFKFITRLRNRFNHLFLTVLEKQVILKNIMNDDDWQKIRQLINFDYARDNFFDELKNMDIMRARVELVGEIHNAQLDGRYYSHTYIRKNILQQDDEDIEQMDAEIAQEMQNPIYQPLFAPEWDANQSQENAQQSEKLAKVKQSNK